MRRLQPVGLSLALAALFVAGCRSSEAEPLSTTPEVAVAERRTLEIQAEAAGAIEPIRVVEVKSKASGEILSLPVETGDRVERGALLADIDPRDVRNSYEQAKADSAVAEARLRTSIAQRERAEELRRAGVVTEQELETAMLDEANSRAQYVKALTALQLAEERLKDVTVRAPINGTIIERPVEIGTIIASASQNVSGGTTLMKMADLSMMQVRALVDETDLGRIRPGLSVQVAVEAYPERRFLGEVMKIEPQAVIDQNVTMFPVMVQLDNSEGLLRPGMNADVMVQIARKEDVLVVPNAAVVSSRDANAVGSMFGFTEEQMRTALRPQSAQPANGARPDSGQAGQTDCQALLQKAREVGGFNNLSEAERTKMRECMPNGMSGQRGGQAGQTGQGGRSGRGGTTGRNGENRPGVVFVMGANGPEPRNVTLGLNDWDYTEIVRGLEEGDSVVIISVARLQQAQQDFLNRMRERAGGQVIPGAGGPPGGGRGR